MRRSAVALGASALALALGAGPAAADPGANQLTTETTGAAQVGAVAVNAPVRVLSDGDSQSAGVAAAAPQTTTESTGGAQVSSVDANAPVRVLSDGDDSSSGAAASGSSGTQSTAGPQTVGDSNGAAQVGSPRLIAPVRVLSADGPSDGGGPLPGGSLPGGSELADEVGGDVEQLLGDLLANPLGSDEVIGGAASALLGDGAGGGGPQPTRSRGLRAPSEPYQRPVVDLYSGQPPLPEAGDVPINGEGGVLAAVAGELPLTGAMVAVLLGMGLSLLSGGAAMRRFA